MLGWVSYHLNVLVEVSLVQGEGPWGSRTIFSNMYIYIYFFFIRSNPLHVKRSSFESYDIYIITI